MGVGRGQGEPLMSNGTAPSPPRHLRCMSVSWDVVCDRGTRAPLLAANGLRARRIASWL